MVTQRVRSGSTIGRFGLISSAVPATHGTAATVVDFIAGRADVFELRIDGPRMTRFLASSSYLQ